MTAQLPFALAAVSSYLIGSIPFGLIVARMKGVDIRKVGSGNIGATNVFRSVSKPLGILTFVLDALKGFVPSLLFPQDILTSSPSPATLALILGVLAIAGHNWPVFLGFKGGKGVATSVGALLGVTPLAIAAGFGAWIIALLLTRMVSVASMVGAVIAAAVGCWIYRETALIPPVLLLLALAIIIRHRGNISRLLKGQEPRVTLGRRPSA